MKTKRFNYHDALFAGSPEHVAEKMPVQSVLFGNSHVGNQAFSNLQVPFTGGVPLEMTITNWYARTTLPQHTDDFREFSNWTMVNLFVGKQPYATASLACLARASSHFPADPDNEDPTTHARREKSRIEMVAQEIYERERDMPRFTSTIFYAKDPSGDDLATRDRYLRLAAIAITAIDYDQWRVYVPERQGLSVHVDMYHPAREALRRIMSSFPSKAAAESRPGLWVHLQGVEFVP